MADSIHSSHCSHCYSIWCSFSLCPLIDCELCYASLHECKREEHREVCRVEMGPCLNVSFGCPLFIRRGFLSHHLAICPASVIACSHERSRTVIDKPAKKQLKAIGKRRTEKEYDCPPSSTKIPIDVSLALFDQRLILDIYTYSRKERTRRRDNIHVREALLPLRPIVDGGMEEGLKKSEPLPTQDEAVDSSEDERLIEVARIKKLRGLFADCYQCQVDASVQHFHTLGRSDARWDLLMYKRNRRSYYQIDPFYTETKLLVSLHIDKIPEAARRSDNILKIRKSGTLFTRRCLCSVPRSEIDAHHFSQHIRGGDDDIDSIIVRCPLWWRGCPFHTTRMRPKEGGEIRFIQELGAFAHRPDKVYKSPILDSSCPLISAPDWALALVARFLSGVALGALAMTCKHLRNTLFSTVAVDRGIVTLKWTKIDRCRWASTPVWSFPVTENSPEFTLDLCPDLSDHIGQCPYNEPCPAPGYIDEEEPVPVTGGMSCLPSAAREAMHDQIRMMCSHLK